TDLGHMPDIVADARTEDKANQASGLAIDCHERRFRIEDSATGEAHDVIQEAQRAAEGVVLVVDLRVDMPAICGRDHGGGGLVISFGPGADFDVSMGSKVRRSRLCET